MTTHSIPSAPERAAPSFDQQPQATLLFSELLSRSPVGLAVVDSDLRYLCLNDTLALLHGVSIADHIGRTAAEVVPDLAKYCQPPMRQVLATGEAVDTEVCHETPLHSGEKRCWLIRCYPVTVQGAAVSRVGLAVIDITDRILAEQHLRDSEERLQAISDLTSDYATAYRVMDDGALCLEWVSSALSEMTGFTQDELRRDGWLSVLVPEDREAARNAIKRVLRGNAAGVECRIHTKAGEIRHIKTYSKPKFDANSQVVGVFSASKDITERKRLEAERERLLLQTERLLADALARADLDPLTGLLNHRAFHSRLELEAERALIEKSSLGIAVLDINNFKFFNEAYGHRAGDDVLRQVADALGTHYREYDVLARFGGDEFAVLLPAIDRVQADNIAESIMKRLEHLSYMPPGANGEIPLSISLGLAVFPDEAGAHLAALDLADERLRQARTGGKHSAEIRQLCQGLATSMNGFTMLNGLVTAVDGKDRYTQRHSEDVLTYSMEIARELGLSTDERQTLALAALLHDVGKIGVPDSILRKPSALDYDEFETIKQHPVMGAMIVGAVDGFEQALPAIQHHHERWDGQGYPAGLSHETIPLHARIMAVADAYSAMTTDRPYRKAFCPDHAQRVLQQGAGAQWDAACVHALLAARTALCKESGQMGS